MKEIDLSLYEMSGTEIDLVNGGENTYTFTIPVSPQGAVVGAVVGSLILGPAGVVSGAVTGFFFGPYM